MNLNQNVEETTRSHKEDRAQGGNREPGRRQTRRGRAAWGQDMAADRLNSCTVRSDKRGKIGTHELTHTPYWAWCRHCVRARGRNALHRTRPESRRDRIIRLIFMDHFYMSIEDQRACRSPILVMVDSSPSQEGQVFTSLDIRG